MKKFICLLISVLMILSCFACGTKKELSSDASVSSENTSDATDTSSAEESVDNPEWDSLDSFGKIQTENGILTVTITLPAEMCSEITQEELDKKVGEAYVSAKLNEDGSVTYKMTKSQHKAMLDELKVSMDSALQELVDDPENSFVSISHNDNYTVFDATLSSSEPGLGETFMVLAFYLYGGMYNIFTGNDVANINVNYYGPNGDLIQSSNSSDMNS